MERQSVSSSNIRSIGYDYSTSTLEVEFIRGRIYQYYNVSASVYSSLMSASSHGQYLVANIVNNFNYKELSCI